MTARRARGFTLIELLVAMAIVAVIGVMAMTGLSEVIHQQTLARERAARWQSIQLAMRVIVQDLAQLQPRPTRDELGEAYMPSLLGGSERPVRSRVQPRRLAKPGGFARGTVLRVAYNFEDDKRFVTTGR
jgi:general secretion pathway protein J